MQLTSIDLAADPGAWTAAGFTVEDGAVTLGAVRVRLVGAGAGRGLVAWSFAAAPAGPLDGLPEPQTAPAPAPARAHPNGITAVDHIVAFSPDLERTVTALEAAGMDLRRRREGPTGGGSARQAFFRVGEAILEVVEHPPQAREAGDAEAPARLWGLALLTPDIEATAAAAGDLVGARKDAIQPGRRIATFTRDAALGAAVAVIQ